MVANFTVPGKPFGKQRPKFSTRGGLVKAITPKDTVNYEVFVKMCFNEQNSSFYSEKPLRVFVDAAFEIPKSTSNIKARKMLTGELLPTKKPDADNIIKVILDALNGVAYKDDTQVVELHFCKFYAVEPNVRVRIEDIE